MSLLTKDVVFGVYPNQEALMAELDLPQAWHLPIAIGRQLNASTLVAAKADPTGFARAQ